MSFPHTLVSLLLVLPFFPTLANARGCSEPFINEAHQINVTQYCAKKTLGAEFAWNYNHSSRQLDIAFGSKLDSKERWLAWGLNPIAPQMVGTQALIGIRDPNGSLEWHKYNITADTKHGCGLSPSEKIGIDVRNFSFTYLEEIEYYMLRATILLPQEYNDSATNIVWQTGRRAIPGHPLGHDKSIKHFESVETLNLTSNQLLTTSAHLRRRIKTVHGVFNIIGWGTLLPIGVIFARYFKGSPLTWNKWFRCHVSCQIAGYITGFVGWCIGISLGENSPNYSVRIHRILAIIILTFSTLQMLAWRFKPGYSDRYRLYWNIYHTFLGYALLAVMSVNIFQGIRLMDPSYPWKWTYVGVLGVLGVVALVFESFAWINFIHEKRQQVASDDKKDKPPM